VRVERLDVHATGRSFDPDLAPVGDAMEAALVPEVREIRPESPEPLGRELEVVGVGERQQAQERAWRTS
jgi:hypothetical protein